MFQTIIIDECHTYLLTYLLILIGPMRTLEAGDECRTIICGVNDHNSVADVKDELLLCHQLISSTVKPYQPCSQDLSSSAPLQLWEGMEITDQGSKVKPILEWTRQQGKSLHVRVLEA